MKKLIKKYLNRETISYVIFGAMTTVVDFIIYELLLAADIHYLIAQWTAWAGAVAFAFVTNKFFVFESKSTRLPVILRELAAFVAARLLSGVISSVILASLVEFVFCPETPAKLITEVFVVVCNYVLSKLIIFRKR